MLKNRKSFNELVDDAKKRFEKDPLMLDMLEEMQADVSAESRIKGTLLTVFLCGNSKK